MRKTGRWLVAAGCLASLPLIDSVISSGGAGNGGGLVPAAQAREREARAQSACSQRSVKGIYSFGLQGAILNIGPIAANGTSTLDGVDQITIKGFITTTTGDPAIEATLVGTYTINPDCTGTATVTIPAPGLFGRFTELTFKAVVVNKNEIKYVVTTPEIVFSGGSVRTSRRLTP